MASESLMHRIAKMRIRVSDNVKNESQELEFIVKWNPQISSLKLTKRASCKLKMLCDSWKPNATVHVANTDPANMVGAYALAVQKHNMACSAARLLELSFQLLGLSWGQWPPASVPRTDLNNALNVHNPSLPRKLQCECCLFREYKNKWMWPNLKHAAQDAWSLFVFLSFFSWLLFFMK